MSKDEPFITCEEKLATMQADRDRLREHGIEFGDGGVAVVDGGGQPLHLHLHLGPCV